MAERARDSSKKKRVLKKKKKQLQLPTIDLSSFSLNPKMLGIGVGTLVAVIVLTMVVRSIGFGNRSTVESSANVQDGVNYLQSLEQKDPSQVQEKLNEVKKKERRQALESGEVSVWSLFYDYAVLGDSRAVGFYFYGFLDESRVLAEAGNTIYNVPDRLSQLQALNPSNVFLCYGINDVSIGYYPTAEVYAEEMDKTVQMIQETLPSATIYINSIFPAKDPAFEQSTDWYEIPDYNVAVKAMCEQKGYHYIDNTVVYEEHNDLYDADGIHFLPSLYDYWGINMIAEME